jgi:hypothetical protein
VTESNQTEKEEEIEPEYEPSKGDRGRIGSSLLSSLVLAPDTRNRFRLIQEPQESRSDSDE